MRRSCDRRFFMCGHIDFADDARRIAGGHGIWRHGKVDDGARSDNGIFADAGAFQQDGSGADPGIAPDLDAWDWRIDMREMGFA